MIRRTKVDPTRVKQLARTQLEAFKADPGLLAGMTALPEEIEVRLAKALAAVDAYEALAATAHAAKAAKERVQDEVFELREGLMGNIELAATRYGISAAEVGELGGKPQPIRRRTKRASAPGVAEGGK